ncbi:DUF5119 domain-containing protein [Bacteroides gallinarum]|uniref:DUF5119 domain-containing protein n=1 Tax=Bacteroides gallinarum TaxID=376806 RepID=UPI000380CE0E|nr:DUF5119 domain-containing protein [Bacteroides gallinarum]
MNAVKKVGYGLLMFLSCLSAAVLSGCGFREVLDDYPVSGVQIVLDWTDVTEKLPETVRVIFYPKDAEGRKVEGYLPATGGEMRVPPGNYAVVAYNYDTESVCIKDDESYETIRAYTEPCTGIDTGEDMVWSPDELYVAASDDVEVMKSETVVPMKLKPERAVSSYSFGIKVNGMENIAAIVCHASGLNGEYFLGKRRCIPAGAPVCVETACKDGMLRGRFSHFISPESAVTRADNPVVLMIKIIRVDTRVQKVEVDIGDLIMPPLPGGEEMPPAPGREIPIEVPVPNGQITVEATAGEGSNGGIDGDVGDWDDETDVGIVV